MSSNTNAANALTAAPSPPIICAAGSMCPQELKIVTDVDKHKCRECEKPMHGYLCSDRTVQEMNGMRCLSCASQRSKLPDDWTTDKLGTNCSAGLRDDGNDHDGLLSVDAVLTQEEGDAVNNMIFTDNSTEKIISDLRSTLNAMNKAEFTRARSSGLAELKRLQIQEQKEIFMYTMEKYKHDEGSREFKLAEEMEKISKARFDSIGEDIKKLEEHLRCYFSYSC